MITIDDAPDSIDDFIAKIRDLKEKAGAAPFLAPHRPLSLTDSRTRRLDRRLCSLLPGQNQNDREELSA